MAASLSTFRSVLDDFNVHITEIAFGMSGEALKRIEHLRGYESLSGGVYASDSRCMMAVFADSAEISRFDARNRSRLRPDSRLVYANVVRYPVGIKGSRCLDVGCLRDAISRSMRKDRDDYVPKVCLPDGNVYNAHYLDSAVRFFDSDRIYVRSMPYHLGGTLLGMCDVTERGFFFIRPVDKAVEYVEYREDSVKEDIADGTLFDLL